MSEAILKEYGLVGARPLDVAIYRDGPDDERNDSQPQGAKP